MTARKKPAKRTRKPGSAGTRLATHSPHRSAIIDLARKADVQAKAAKFYMGEAVNAALHCGQLLLKERSWFDRTLGRKHKGPDGKTVPAQPWAAYYEANYLRALPPAEADRYLRLARREEVQGELDLTAPGGANALRAGMLALALFPQKTHEPIVGDGKVPTVGAHLTAANRIAKWWKDLTRRQPSKDMTDAAIAQLLADLGPVAAVVDTLRSERELRSRLRSALGRRTDADPSTR